jgi:hypothetical protein
MRPPDATELLLTNNGDELLEGSVTNFFVVCKVRVHSFDPPNLFGCFLVQHYLFLFYAPLFLMQNFGNEKHLCASILILYYV